MSGRFAGRVAVVTGGGGGIGTAICRRLAREGATVIVADAAEAAAIAVADELATAGFQAETCVLDITSPPAIAQAVASVIERHRRIDVLVNNAGINRRGALLDLTVDDWEATFAVNLDAVFHLTRAVLPHMIDRGGGAVVNTASQWGISAAPGHIAYNVSKAAVVSFTKSLAVDYAQYGVRVNAVAPGEIHTPMLEAGVAASGRTMADLDAKVPFGRVGTPDEVAALVAFLASDEAPFLCGSVVEITGAQAVA
ncbi:MAG: SDR family NAD(P)-dependent oxidoreductase [Beutenbergiaceae bacterium]